MDIDAEETDVATGREKKTDPAGSRGVCTSFGEELRRAPHEQLVKLVAKPDIISVDKSYVDTVGEDPPRFSPKDSTAITKRVRAAGERGRCSRLAPQTRQHHTGEPSSTSSSSSSLGSLRATSVKQALRNLLPAAPDVARHLQ